MDPKTQTTLSPNPLQPFIKVIMKTETIKHTPGPPCECGNPEASWHGDRNGLRERMCETCWENKQLRECATCLFGVVSDVMPQMRRLVLQDYERLNRGLILANELKLKAT